MVIHGINPHYTFLKLINFFLCYCSNIQTGPKDLTEKNQGVNYRALGDLFFLAEQRKDIFRYDVAVQMIRDI